MKVIPGFTFTFSFLLLINILHGADPGWMQLPTGTTEDLHTINFFNADTGYAASRKTLLKTCDGGLNWQSVVLDSTNRTFDLYMFSADRGICVKELSKYGPGAVFGTSNGGITWDTLLYLGPEYTFYTIFFLDDNLGWISGEYVIPLYSHSFTIKTTDGGVNWSLPGNSCMTWIYSLFFLNSDHGVAAGYQEDWSYWQYLNLNITTDSGTNWQWTNGIPWLMGELYSVHFVNDSIGFTAGRMSDSLMYYEAACVFKSIDGGRHWQLKLFDLKLCWDSFNDVHFVNADTGWVISEDGRILRTDNGGDRWYFQDSGINSPLNEIFFLDENTGWIAGDDGILLRTSSGGITAIDSEPLSRENIPESVRLYQNYPNPFNPRTVISWELTEAGEVTLEVYNLQGQKIKTLFSAFLQSGYHSVTFDAAELPSGIYFYRLQAGEEIHRRKMVLVK